MRVAEQKTTTSVLVKQSSINDVCYECHLHVSDPSWMPSWKLKIPIRLKSELHVMRDQADQQIEPRPHMIAKDLI